MKSWFEKFARAQNEIDGALRSRPAIPQADSDLHDSIMRAVRGAAREETAESKSMGVWLAPAFIVASLAAVSLGVWLSPVDVRPKTLVPSSEMAAAPGTALDLSAQIPGMAFAPLSNELAHVNQDLHQTTQVLLASFP